MKCFGFVPLDVKLRKTFFILYMEKVGYNASAKIARNTQRFSRGRAKPFSSTKYRSSKSPYYSRTKYTFSVIDITLLQTKGCESTYTVFLRDIDVLETLQIFIRITWPLLLKETWLITNLTFRREFINKRIFGTTKQLLKFAMATGTMI